MEENEGWSDKPSNWSIPAGCLKISKKPTCVAVDTGTGTAYQVTYHFTYGKPTEAGLMILDLPPYRFDPKQADSLGNECVVALWRKHGEL